VTGLAVICRRVVHIYRAEGGDVVALAGVDLDIAPGETVALVGPSGSGKSTLIALLSGLMRPSAGRVQVGLMDIGRLTEAELARLRGTDIGVVLQGGAERNLLPYATLADNLWYAQRRAARVRPADVEPPERIAALLGLLGDVHRRVAELPPGARQRAALAAGMAASPGLLLVDEPTSQLDSAGRDEVLDALHHVNSERGTTIVVVTHDAEVGARLGRQVTIRDGRVGAEGRGGMEFAVLAGDGTVQLPPEVLGSFAPGTLFAVEQADGAVTLVADLPGGAPAPGQSAPAPGQRA
jgi:putative ABC transport system ATP-binding protein